MHNLGLKKTILTGSLTLIVLQFVLSRDKFYLGATIISSIVFVVLYFLIFYIALNNTRKLPGSDGTILGPRDLEFNDSGIICDTKDSHSVYGWATVKQLAVGKKAFYLYVDTNMAMIIPKRIFASEKEKNDFEQFVATKVTKD